jgi:glycosyltransferase involved in cell wall biosynthesis
MLQFEDHLVTGLKGLGVAVSCFRPSPCFSRFTTRNRLLWKWLGYLDKFVLFPFRLAFLRIWPTAVIHVCDHSNAIYLNFLPSQRCLLTCHDLLAVRSARGEFTVHRTGWTGRILQRWILSGLRRAKLVVCDSEATRSDVLRIIGPRPPSEIVNIGVADTYFSEVQKTNAGAPGNKRQTKLLSTPFLLHVGGTQWYKNRPTVRRVYRRLRERLGGATPALVIVGEPDGVLPQSGEELLSDLSVRDLAECYRRAALLLFPSYAEGFGLPIIEAQASGCLVVTTALAPMNDIGGDAALYVADPEDVEGFVCAVQQVLTLDPAEAQRRRKLGYQNAERFRTDAMVAGYLRVYEGLAG